MVEARNIELKNKHLNQRAFLIGNGPSILKQNLKKLNKEITFVFNSFFLHEEYEEINPTYLCSCDPSLEASDFRKQWYLLQQEKTQPTIKLFSKRVETIDKQEHLFQDHQVYYLHTPNSFSPALSTLESCSIDLTKPLSGHGLVFIDVALMSAYYMGIKEIYLLGMDGGKITSLDDYLNYNFYGKHPLVSMEEYEFNYHKYHVNPNFHKSRKGLYEKSVGCIKRTFEEKGISIFNATLNGYDTGFPRVDFEDIL
jgi:hypothetical protein